MLQAISEPGFSVAYANMCKYMINVSISEKIMHVFHPFFKYAYEFLALERPAKPMMR